MKYSDSGEQQDTRHAREVGLDPDTRQRTNEARSVLYPLIARFRKDAAEANNQAVRSIFEFAAEVLAGLTRAFRQFEEEAETKPETNDGDKGRKAPQ